MEKKNDAGCDLLAKAKADLMTDMASKGIAALIWDVSEAGFHYIPEIELPDSTEEDPKVSRISGVYAYGGELYLIEDEVAEIDYSDFYDSDSEVKPVVVTLSPDLASKYLGDPQKEKGYTTDGDLEEWLAVADCYFEALNEE